METTRLLLSEDGESTTESSKMFNILEDYII